MIIIKHEHIEQIKRHGEKTYNEECCGAILGNSKDEVKVVHELIEFHNEKNDNRQRRYLITPGQYRQSEKLADEKNLELLGFYHSHPDHPSLPSEFDKDHALPWFLYMIVSVEKGKAKKLSAWTLKDDRTSFEEHELNVTQTTENINRLR